MGLEEVKAILPPSMCHRISSVSLWALSRFKSFKILINKHQLDAFQACTQLGRGCGLRLSFAFFPGASGSALGWLPMLPSLRRREGHDCCGQKSLVRINIGFPKSTKPAKPDCWSWALNRKDFLIGSAKALPCYKG